MRDLSGSSVRKFVSGWFFWCLVLLALPNCSSFDSAPGDPPPPPALNAGELPHTSAVMCDIEKYQAPGRRCANPQDLKMGIPLTQVAEALVAGRLSNVGLDYSPAAKDACGGLPQAIDFRGAFPDGYPVCLNCGVMPVIHANATAVCVAQCKDLAKTDTPVPPDIAAFCAANARPSTHFKPSGCYENACSGAGTLAPTFEDERRNPEPVVWVYPIGTLANGSSITQTSPTTGGDIFAAGAVSEQWVNVGDAYVEVQASENNLSHVVGFAEVGGCVFPCPDTDPGLADIDFGLSLNNNGRIYILDPTAPDGIIAGPDLGQSFGTYAAGERFRVRVKDQFGDKGTVRYTRIVGPCLPGNACNEVLIHEYSTPTAHYPMRAAAAFREQGATLANVSFVRIQ